MKEEAPITALGSYVEKELLLPTMEEGEYRIGCKVNSEDQLEIYTAIDSEDRTTSQIFCYTLINDSFQKSPVEWANNACKELHVGADAVCESEDGNEYMQLVRVTKIDDQASLTKVLIRKTDDAKGYEDITPDYWCNGEAKMAFSGGPSINSLKVLKNHIMCYHEDGGNEFIFYDLNKNELVDYDSNPSVKECAIKDNTIYYLSIEKDTVEIHDLENDHSESVDLVSKKSDPFERNIVVGPNNEITMLDKSGLHILQKDGTLWETIADGSQYSMSVPSYEVESFLTVPGTATTYIVLYRSKIEGKNDLLVRYEPSSEGVITFSKELTICSLYDNASIREMIHSYRKKHPEVKVSYEVMLNEESGMTKTDVVRTLNTELLAGKGADIIVMDDLPLKSYIEKGVLMDISDIFNTSDQEGIIIKNVSDQYTTNGKIYGMPMRVLFPYYGLHEDISSYTNSVEDLAAYCQDKETNLVETTSYGQLVQSFLANYSNEVFDQEGLIDREGLSSFLRSMDIIAKQTNAQPEFVQGFYDNPGVDGRTRNYYLGLMDTLMWKDHTLVAMDFLSSQMQVETLYPILREMKGCYVPINHTFIPNGIVGINNLAKEPELAKEFVTGLFDESIQSYDIKEGFPVNEKALDQWSMPYRRVGCTGYSTQEGGYELIFYDSLTPEEMQLLISDIKSLTLPIYSDSTGCDIIVGGAVEYLKGEKTLKQAVDDIIQKGNLYFSE